MQTALLNIMFVGRQFELNPKEEVQQYMNNEVDDILHFDDRAVFSLMQMMFFSQHYSYSQMRFVLCIFHLIPEQIIPCFRLAITRLSHIFIVICVVNSLLK